MLTSNTRLKLQGILRRIAHQEEVGLSDRIYVQKFADHDATVASWFQETGQLYLEDQDPQAFLFQNQSDDEGTKKRTPR